MKFYIGNWENDTVTTVTEHPSDRQLRNALKRMHGNKFRFAPVGDHSVSDDLIHEYNERIAN